MPNSLDLPTGLPVPKDDGAAITFLVCKCRNYGSRPPKVIPFIWAGSAAAQWSIAILGPGNPDQPIPDSWDAIPGARGCTPQCRGFRDQYHALTGAGAAHLFGLSTQDTDYQKEAAGRLELPYPLLSDRELSLVRALRLPTFQFDSMTLIKRLTLIIDDGRITKVFYPVFPPDKSAEETLEWLRQNPFGG